MLVVYNLKLLVTTSPPCKFFAMWYFSIHLKLCQRASLHCNENPIYLFPEKELCGHSPNIHIHVSESDLYFPESFCIFSYKSRPILGIYKSLTDTWMWEFGTEAAQILIWEYLFQIFHIVSLQYRETSGIHKVKPWYIARFLGQNTSKTTV